MECPKCLAPLALAAFLPACAPDERPVLRIVSDATFAPFHFISDGGTPTGFDIELVRLIAERVGLEPTVEVLPYGELFEGLSAKAHDVVAATTGWTAERAAAYLFTEPYFVTCQVALVRVGSDEPATLAELSGRRVGASGSGTAARAMRSIEGATPVTLEEGAGLEPLLTGAVDAIIVDEFDAVEAARESDGQLRVLAQPVASERYAFVLARDRHALKAQLDQALATLEAEGEVAALRARFGVERDAEWPVQIVQIGSGMVVTEGVAQKSGPCSVTIDCPVDGNVREAFCGEITAADGSVWEVPGPITDGAALVDVYNECTVGGDNPDFESELATIVVDEDGSEVTAYLFGDNYFELYANGRFIGRDAVGFTPFNAHAARYRAAYPITYAVLLVDWEGYLGVGLEDTRNRFHIGDGGFIASFSDGARTGTEWKCKVFYISPLDDASCIEVDAAGNPDSSGCPSSDDTVACISSDPTSTCRGAHFELPSLWMSPDFDDSAWLQAKTYTADEVTGSPGFRNYEHTLFKDAAFIWTQNLRLDNLVACRVTVAAPP
ncbi:MAG: amino acid ABC transporter substrate-binding protein [Acidobacteria bacterium]|nr:MAG: amino acid ABC transporter substrate-binding protein [Acidobacteriota bacterium]